MRELLLPNTGFSDEKDRGVGCSDFLGPLDDLADGGSLSFYKGKRVLLHRFTW
ncbi:hypothetical protein D3C87_2210700 [compost metagenome]